MCCRFALRRFTNYINEHHGSQRRNPFFEITQPHRQIETILDNLRLALAKLSDIGIDEISVSVIYRTDKKEDWQWLSSVNIDCDLELNDLIRNQHTTARQIIDGVTDLVFFPDKREGLNQQKYVPGKRDASRKNMGSILCKNISLETKMTCIQAVLSIATYGLQLCAMNDIDTQNTIVGLLLPSFERRLQLELALLYIKEEMSVQINSKNKHPSSTRYKSRVRTNFERRRKQKPQEREKV